MLSYPEELLGLIWHLPGGGLKVNQGSMYNLQSPGQGKERSFLSRAWAPVGAAGLPGLQEEGCNLQALPGQLQPGCSPAEGLGGTGQHKPGLQRESCSLQVSLSRYLKDTMQGRTPLQIPERPGQPG